jgi:hypothetical protein
MDPIFSLAGELISSPSQEGQCPDANNGPLKWARTRRETMKTMFLAAAAALSLGVGAAYAGDGEGPQANTLFTSLPGVIAQAPVQNAPAVATAQNGQAVHTYATQSNHGTWLFAPNGNQGANS